MRRLSGDLWRNQRPLLWLQGDLGGTKGELRGFDKPGKKQLCPVRRTLFFCFTSSGTTETRTRTNKNLKNPSNECAQCCPHKHNRGGLTEEPHTVTHSDSHTHVKTHEECWVFREDGSVYCQWEKTVLTLSILTVVLTVVLTTAESSSHLIGTHWYCSTTALLHTASADISPEDKLWK